MRVRASIDSNILIYAALEPDSDKGQRSAALISAIAPSGIITAQALLEFIAVVRRKKSRLLAMAISQAALWSDVFEVAPTSASTVSKAAAVVSRHKLQVWDAVVMVAAQEAGASVLYSEDMQDGAILAGVQIVNPFVMSDAAFASLIP